MNENSNSASVYLDAAATAPALKEAVEAFVSAASLVGNPSSVHAEGLKAAALLSECRRTVLSSLGVGAPTAPASFPGLVFTSGGTESDSLALRGTAKAKARNAGGRIIISKGEHPAIRETCRALADEGFEIVEIPTAGGVLDLEYLKTALTAPASGSYTGRPLLLSLMTVNNETGAVYDVKAAFSLAKKLCPEIVTHTDATQAFGKLAVSPSLLGAELITVSAHKIGGIKGCGALYIDPALIRAKKLAAVTVGGGQESGIRSGTENLPGIAAFAAACRTFGAAPGGAAKKGAEAEEKRRYLLDRLPNEVTANLPLGKAAPHILSLRLPGIKSETMLRYLSSKGYCVSSGSACSAHSRNISYALRAFGLDDRAADSTIRVSPADNVGTEELDGFLAALGEGVRTLVRS